MQGDAFPTPPIYSHHFHHIAEELPSNLLGDRHRKSDASFQHLFEEIDVLMSDCSKVEAKEFWMATNRIKVKHHIMASMQKIESLFLDLASETTSDQDLITAVADSLLYSSHSRQFSQASPSDHSHQREHLPHFLKATLSTSRLID